ncbi:thymidine kinase [Pseudoalteromonas luteoviolacea]|uniref:Thymidine kinase n=1 Tax=Pseudoalteromonas luteoviolacea S4054 TaxID=1129367 RepID=A0A0F6A5L7_9GAMM|nr:thymidine kinase [Pseudoalteromonas luteoviolacea]AOT10477.1 thymidine kinase [Pseudoalteromonas luteoviolacea]AOT15454.1 thymidine kinase [Pseudoalteromonas luteoviolacea]AOT20296.1 thymidine kinase [Pseudoalteromonas luteoviolacea]KKE81388.1 thymidine kinase [Pseudoalteromonas luteoviolacea S4054]KZN71587.1 thymidine kinase [Pseudoalteromonas luteoviolacea S4047-1]
MAQLYFYYSAMNAGKSTTLLQSAFNYRERGMTPFILTAAIDNRSGVGKVASRIGLEADASTFEPTTNVFELVHIEHQKQKLDCILVDESQFLSKEQVSELTDVVDSLGVPVLCYGLRTDFRGELFEGAQYLLAWADKLIELKTVCHCGRKANHVLRLDEQGNAIADGDQVEIGGNDRYVSVCRKHYKTELNRL